MYLLINDPEPLQTIVHRIGKNFRQYRLNFKQGKPFIYLTKLGFKFLCIPDVKTSVNLYVRQPAYEEIELKIAQQWLQEGDSCLDIGANVGYFSAMFAEKVSENGKVIAIEASPQTAKHLGKVIQILGLRQICLEQVCVTDTNGFVEFMVGSSESSDVRQSLRVSPEIEELFKREIVVSATVNNLIKKHKIHQNISLVKIDIEGAEPLALRGGKLLFQEKSLPLFIVEVYKLGLSRFGFEPKDVVSFFSLDLFDIYQVNRSHPNPLPELKYGVLYPLLNPDIHSWPWHTNIIAIPKVGKYKNRKSQIKTNLLCR